MRGRKGLIWLEVLTAVTVSGFLILAGMRLLSALLEQQARLALAETASTDIARLQQEIGRAWDARIGHRFQEGFWLSIEGTAFEGELELERLSFRKSGQEGRAMEWQLAALGRGWRIREVEAGMGTVTERKLSYEGRILLNGHGGNWNPGTVPERLEFRFPDAARPEVRVGFAIRGYW
ncbi:MAG: hypothetical protein R6V45_04885 [Oceanipulchritudo sp.]